MAVVEEGEREEMEEEEREEEEECGRAESSKQLLSN
jgi:hypothetical protein